MKLAARIGLVIGLAIAVALILREGGPLIAGLLSSAGWVLLWLVPLHALPLVLDASGWQVLLRSRAPLPVLFWIATVREAINRLLPVASIGGDIVGIRLLAAQGVDGTVAAASVVMEVLLTLVSQFLLAVTGVVLLLHLTGAVQLRAGLLLALAFALLIIVAFGLVLRYGSLFTRIERVISQFVGVGPQLSELLGQSARLDAAVSELYAARGRMAGTVALQVSGLVAGSLETWLALRWLGHPVGLTQALVLESVTQALRQIVFVIPAGLGVQEMGLVGVGYLLGVPSEMAIALSLAKRMREVLFGLPALLSWQLVEGWRGLQDVRSHSQSES